MQSTFIDDRYEWVREYERMMVMDVICKAAGAKEHNEKPECKECVARHLYAAAVSEKPENN